MSWKKKSRWKQHVDLLIMQRPKSFAIYHTMVRKQMRGAVEWSFSPCSQQCCPLMRKVRADCSSELSRAISPFHPRLHWRQKRRTWWLVCSRSIRIREFRWAKYLTIPGWHRGSKFKTRRVSLSTEKIGPNSSLANNFVYGLSALNNSTWILSCSSEKLRLTIRPPTYSLQFQKFSPPTTRITIEAKCRRNLDRMLGL